MESENGKSSTVESANLAVAETAAPDAAGASAADMPTQAAADAAAAAIDLDWEAYGACSNAATEEPASSPYVEPFENEYDFDEEPVVAPKPLEQRPRRPISPVVTFHKKTQRNGFMLIIAGLIAAAGGAVLLGQATDFGDHAFAVVLTLIGLTAFTIGFFSVSKTNKLLKHARRDFAQDRAMRIYLDCCEDGIEDCKTDEQKDRILARAVKHGFDMRNEAVGLYDAGRKLTLQGKKPNPDYDKLK